ncbi:hypothetical protein GX411_03725 [Candidatus Fermentibacteria bacterium]|nr:hypothetical protein [Candidatus Fermentibacteria bacterium]
MMISAETTLEDLAGIVCSHLLGHGIRAVLSGGGAVALYADNRFTTCDLDFVTDADPRRVERVMAALGFARKASRHFEHPATCFLVEFPAGPLAIGDRPVTKVAEIETRGGRLLVLTPTQCVMDRLAAWYHWSDPQALQQAILVSLAHGVDQDVIEEWSGGEGKLREYRNYLRRLEAGRMGGDPSGTGRTGSPKP